MKKAMLLMAALAGAAFAQDLAGSWQGTLSAGGRDLRVVVKLTKADGAALKGTMYSIDQGGAALGLTSVALQGGTVKFALGGIGASFEGKLAADGNSIAGTWNQGGSPMPLTLARATAETAWPIPEPPAALKPMRADANPSFEVATIKPSKPDAQGKGIMMRGRNFSTLNTSLIDLVSFAYGMQAKQIAGGPAWMESEFYDLAGTPDGEGMPNEKQLKSMIQKLLAERFQLTFHRDKKELSVYAITVAKGGAKMAKSEADPNSLPGLMFRGLGVLPCHNASVADLAGVMQSTVLDRPVVDQTGLTGKFDFTLTWTPDEFQFRGLGARVPPPTDNPSAPPDLFTAFQQQLGLKLDSTKALTEVLVIDRVEKPSAN